MDGIQRGCLELLKKNPRRTIWGMIVIALLSLTLSFTLCSRSVSYYGTINDVPQRNRAAGVAIEPLIDEAQKGKGVIGTALALQRLINTRKEIEDLLAKDSLTRTDSARLNALLDAHDSLQTKKVQP